MNTKKDIQDALWLTSYISAFINEGCDTTSDGLITWLTRKGELMLDTNNKELRLIDWVGDMKTTYALMYLAQSHGYTTGDYFTSR